MRDNVGGKWNERSMRDERGMTLTTRLMVSGNCIHSHEVFDRMYTYTGKHV